MHIPRLIRHYAVAVKGILLFSVVCGLVYPAVFLGIGQLPGVRAAAHGSLRDQGGQPVGSSLIGQSFTDEHGNPVPKYFQSRPSAAGKGYDPSASSASNLGPENILDTLPNPAGDSDTAKAGKQSLLTQVCARSLAAGTLEGVDGSRPYCTPDGVGAVLALVGGYSGKVTAVVSVNQACPSTPFLANYQGLPVQCAEPGADYSAAKLVPIRGNAPAQPIVPADAVTASGSGLDPAISPAYAQLQAPRIARERHMDLGQVRTLIERHTTKPGAGFIGQEAVNVLELNLDLDKNYPVAN